MNTGSTLEEGAKDVIRSSELDYDAKPKMEMLDLDIRRKVARLWELMLLAKDDGELEHLLVGTEHYYALADDVGRVKEIRERARERGIVPSARPLRFLPPEPGERSDPADVARYAKASAPARRVVERALVAYRKADTAGFAKRWKPDYAERAKRELESERSSDARYGYTYDLLTEYRQQPLSEILHRIDNAVTEFAQGLPQGDDQTVILLRRCC